jgi:hypothetical protein
MENAARSNPPVGVEVGDFPGVEDADEVAVGAPLAIALRTGAHAAEEPTTINASARAAAARRGLDTARV